MNIPGMKHVRVCGRLLEDETKCREAGVKLPQLRVWADKAKTHPPLEFVLRLPICEGHAKSMRIGDVLSEKGWHQIYDALVGIGKAAPVRETAELAWVGLEYLDAFDELEAGAAEVERRRLAEEKANCGPCLSNRPCERHTNEGKGSLS